MGRLIDADELIEKINNFHIADARCVTVMNGVVNLIKEQPTAYYVANVVEELDSLRITGNSLKFDLIPYNNAIEIVK